MVPAADVGEGILRFQVYDNRALAFAHPSSLASQGAETGASTGLTLGLDNLTQRRSSFMLNAFGRLMNTLAKDAVSVRTQR